MVEQRLELNGAWFELVCVRQSGVAVFQGDGTFLRLGSAISDELEVQRRMLELGYPVPDIVEVGEHAGAAYVIEESLGDRTLGDVWADRTGGARTTDHEFSAFLDVMRRQARAQLNDTRPWRREDVADFLGVARTCANVPALAGMVEGAFGRAVALLRPFPSSLQHGDLHPFNTCPAGIIDLEDAGWAPAGYDVTTAVLDPTLADSRWDHARPALAWFTSRQVTVYLSAVDEEFRRAMLPPPSGFLDAYLVCRAIAICSRIPRDGAIWDRRQRMLDRALTSFLDEGRFPIELEADA